MNLRSLTDKTLLDQTAQLAKTEREVTLKILRHLWEISRRRLFSELGHSSLFSYCVEALKYSESAAHRRIQAMHALVEIPELEGKIESGALTLSNLASAQTKFYQSKKAGKPLATADKKEILKSLEGKSKREAERDLEKTFPKQTTVSIHSDIPQQTLLGFQPDLDLGLDLGLGLPQSATVEFKSLPPEQMDKTSATKRMVPVNEDLIIKLKGLLAHKAPGISDENLIEMVLIEFVQKLDPAQQQFRKKKAAASASQAVAVEANAETAAKEKDEAIVEADIKTNVETKFSAKTKVSANAKIARQKLSKAVPVAIRRSVWRRAGSCCEICKSQYALQLDHVWPRSFGGDNSPENLRLLCRNCNQRQAIVKLGSKKMDPYLSLI